MDNKKKLIELINHYGIMEQLKYIHSEYFELDEAIINEEFEHHYESIEHISEEIADVMVMLKQFQYYYDITDERLEEIMNYKIDRQLGRIHYENKQ